MSIAIQLLFGTASIIGSGCEGPIYLSIPDMASGTIDLECEYVVPTYYANDPPPESAVEITVNGRTYHACLVEELFEEDDVTYIAARCP